MKKLYLLRHANTQPNIDDDRNREITSRGIREIESVAEQFSLKNPKIDIVLCSTSVRTKQTLAHLEDFTHRNFNTNYEENLYNPSLDDFIKTLQDIPNDFTNVMTVSHNPTISEIANYIIGENTILFSTSNIAKFDLKIEKWSQLKTGCAELKWIIKPNS